MKPFHHRDYALRNSPNNFLCINTLMRIVALLALTALPCSQSNADDLFEYKAIYSGRYFGFNVEFEREMINQKSQQWQLSHNFSNFWIKIHEQSNFSLSDRAITAQHYKYTRRGVGKNRLLDIRFDHTNGKALVEREDKEKRYNIEPGIIDKLNYQVALRLALLADPQLQSFTTKIADSSRVKTYAIQFDANETLTTKLGKVNTVRFRRDRKNSKGEVVSSTVIWMAPDWQYLPARIQQIEDGKTYTLNIESLKVSKPPANSALTKFKS